MEVEMLFKRIPLGMCLMLVLSANAKAGESPLKSEADVNSKKLQCAYEFGGAAAGFTLMRLALMPVDALYKSIVSPKWTPAYSENVRTAFEVGSTTFLTVSTALGTWCMGRLCKDDGSLIGALLGAGMGSGLFTYVAYTRGWNDLGPLAIGVCRLLPPALAFAGYKLIPPIKLKTKSLGFDLRPTIGEQGAGVQASLKF